MRSAYRADNHHIHEVTLEILDFSVVKRGCSRGLYTHLGIISSRHTDLIAFLVSNTIGCSKAVAARALLTKCWPRSLWVSGRPPSHVLHYLQCTILIHHLLLSLIVALIATTVLVYCQLLTFHLFRTSHPIIITSRQHHPVLQEIQKD